MLARLHCHMIVLYFNKTCKKYRPPDKTKPIATVKKL
jgi:hypothetical protein